MNNRSCVFIRHTRVAAPGDVCYGQDDVALAASFEEEYRTLRQRVARSGRAALCFSSPLQRCRQLAEALCADLAPEASIRLDDRLLELNFGEWQGRRWDTVDAASLDQWARHLLDFAPPGGESYAQLLERVGRFLAQLDELLEEAPPGAIWIVAHGGSIRAALATLLEIPPARAFDIELRPGGIAGLRRVSGRYRLEELINPGE